MQNKFYMKDEVSFKDFPVYAEKSRGGSRVLKVFIVLLLLVAAIVAGLYFLGTTRRSNSGTAVVPTESPVPTEPPSPAATTSATLTPAQLERSELAVSVLNGSGVRGAANTTAATLRNAGYAVGATGNAARFDYAGITILVKKAESRYADLLKEDLNAPNATVTTDDTIATDAVVIVGR